MYILYHGEAGVYFDPELKTCVATKTPNSIIGETALLKDDARSASVVANTNVKMLILKKRYYKSILFNVKQKQMFQNLDFLQKVDFFKNWGLIKLQSFNHSLNE